MTSGPRWQSSPGNSRDPRAILLAYGLCTESAGRILGVACSLESVRLTVCRTHTGKDTIARVEQGGLSAAVVCGDDVGMDGLSVLRIIRSIDDVLPCWLVTTRPSRQVLEAALALRVTSVITHPLDEEDLLGALRRVLMDPINDN
ncbi:MAG: hypothetical protein ACE5E5_06025 [Phycisphaerae bacterium]